MLMLIKALFNLGIVDFIHQLISFVMIEALVEGIEPRPLGHSANQLTWLELPDLHVLIDYLILTLITKTVQQLVALDVCFNYLSIYLQKLNFPEFFEKFFFEEEDLGPLIVIYNPVL